MLIALSIQCGCVESLSFTPTPPTVPALRLPMNNAYLGSVHSSDLRPKFVWEPSTAESSGEIRYELQFSTDSTFPASDVTTIETFETSYQPPAALPVSLVAPVGARYFWHVRACLRNSCSDYARPWYANVGRVINDYNCDGYSDLAVGSPGDDSFYPDAGRVRVYFGNKESIVDNMADGLLGGYNELDMDGRAGDTIAAVGDLNGDGCADLVWSIPANPPITTAGHVFLFSGSPGTTFDGLPDTELSSGEASDGYGRAAAGVGDLNGDNFDDFYVLTLKGATIYHGEAGIRNDTSSDGILETAERFSMVKGAGDINGDGAADLIAGEEFALVDGVITGAAYVYLGVPGDGVDSGSRFTLNGRGYHDLFGATVASAGDVNGDGFSDVLAANVRDADNGRGQSGSVDLFLGGKGNFDVKPDVTLSGTISNDYFGGAMLGVGDVNGDGFGDVLIGAPQSDIDQVDKFRAGKAYLHLGGHEKLLSQQADATFEGSTQSGYLGRKVSAGDFNGDGVNDIAISVPGYSSDMGRLDIFLGAEQVGFDSLVDVTLTGIAAGDSFGQGLASF
jgi:FG-GAP repeat